MTRWTLVAVVVVAAVLAYLVFQVMPMLQSGRGPGRQGGPTVRSPADQPAPATRDTGRPESEARSDSPEVIALHPSRALAGERFNRQPDGRAAIAVTGRRFTGESAIYFGDRRLETVFGGEGLLTAVVPDELIAKPGEIAVSVVTRAELKSNTAVLRILQKP